MVSILATPPSTETLNWLLWEAARIEKVGTVADVMVVDAAAPDVALVAAPMLREDAVPVALVTAEVRVSSPVCAPPTKAQLATTLPAPMPDVSIALWRPIRKAVAPPESAVEESGR